jgi:hypothetical protein
MLRLNRRSPGGGVPASGTAARKRTAGRATTLVNENATDAEKASADSAATATTATPTLDTLFMKSSIQVARMVGSRGKASIEMELPN